MVLHGYPRGRTRTRICSLVTMEAATRSYEAVPPEAADVLRPVLPALSDETIAAIAREVPSYARAMEGEFGQVVRRGVEVAFNRFVDLLADPGAGRRRARAHVRRPRPRRVPRRAAASTRCWRPTASARGWPGGASSRRASPAGSRPAAIYSLGEAIFAYIDELSAESAEGYAEEQSVAAGESERRRRRLVRLLAQDPPAGQEAVRDGGGRRDVGAPARRARRAGGRDGSGRRARARRTWTRSPRGSRGGSARGRSAPRRSARRSSSSPTRTRRAAGAGWRPRSATAPSRSARRWSGRAR